MRRTTMLILLLLLGCWASIFADKVVQFRGLMRPGMITIDKDRIYVADGVTVLIYSLTDFTLKKKFGKAGEGPREFQIAPQFTYPNIDVKILPDRILVNSLSKMSYFTKDGKFIEEMKPAIWAWYLTPLGKNFVGRRTILENNLRFHVVLLIDGNFKDVKEIYREVAFFQANKTLDPVFRRAAIFHVYNNKVIVDNKEKGQIYIFDVNGKKIKTISHPFKRVKFTSAHEKKLIEFFLSDPVIRPQYEASKHLVKFSSYFPYIWDHQPANDKIYVLTYEEQDGKNKFYIFAMDGTFLKTSLMKMPQIDAERPYPYVIANEKLYQLVENEEEEEWELHIKEFK
jgi:hypothetical protein